MELVPAGSLVPPCVHAHPPSCMQKIYQTATYLPTYLYSMLHECALARAHAISVATGHAYKPTGTSPTVARDEAQAASPGDSPPAAG